MSDAEIRRLWETIERVLRESAPDTAATLAPPATDRQLDELESVVGRSLPSELRASLKIHGGQRDPTRCHGFTGEGLLLGTSGIGSRWKTTTDLDDGQRLPDGEPWWKPSCIPFADAEGDMLCIDMDPELGDRVGEVVCHVHDGVIERGVAADFGHWLATVADRLDRGRFVIDEHGYLTLDDEAPRD